MGLIFKDWLRFFDRVEKTPTCWFWVWSQYPNGYAKFFVDGKYVLAHRWVYQKCVGNIPVGLVLDHLCRISICVNPSHLEPVTQAINILRGESFAAIQARRTHCLKAGHPLFGENLFINAKGERECLICRKESIKINNALAKQRREQKALGLNASLWTT